jgi:hypothetical protein
MGKFKFMQAPLTPSLVQVSSERVTAFEGLLLLCVGAGLLVDSWSKAAIRLQQDQA